MVYEDFVTYNQAVKLKELGFDWECNHYYLDYDESFHIGFYENFNSIKSIMEANGELISVQRISAPTLAQAQKWLFEKFGFWVEIGLCPELDSTPHKFIWMISHKKTGHVTHGDGNLREGIDNVFELIKKLK